MRKVIIIGTGGHAVSLIDVIESTGKYEILGLIKKTDDPSVSVSGYQTIGTDKDLKDIKKRCATAAIGIGQIKTPNIRLAIYNRLLKLGFDIPTMASSEAYVSRNSKIGVGTIIHHQSIINAGAKIGSNCIINSKALIEHGSIIGSNCHISTNVTINGNVTVGDGTFIGSGSIIHQNINIPNASVIKSGSIVRY